MSYDVNHTHIIRLTSILSLSIQSAVVLQYIVGGGALSESTKLVCFAVSILSGLLLHRTQEKKSLLRYGAFSAVSCGVTFLFLGVVSTLRPLPDGVQHKFGNGWDSAAIVGVFAGIVFGTAGGIVGLLISVTASAASQCISQITKNKAN